MTRTARATYRGIVPAYGLSAFVLFIFSVSCNSEAWTGSSGRDIRGDDGYGGLAPYHTTKSRQHPPRESYPRFIHTTLIEPKSSPSIAPTEVKSPIEAIREMLRAQEFDDALKAASNFIKENPNNPDGYIVQGGAYAGKKDFANARKSFDKALSLQPDNVQTLAALGRLDLEVKDIAGARRRYQTILAKDPKNITALLLMAQLEANAKNDKAELEWLEKAKSANPKAPAPRIYLGSYYIRAGKFDKALVELTEADQNTPNNPQILELIGQAQVNSGQKSTAVSTYNKLVSLTPTSPTAHYRLGMARINAEDIPGGTESLKRALQLKPDYAEAVYALAVLDVRAKRYDEALKRARGLQKLSPKSPAGFSIEGDVLVAQQRYPDAAKAYEAAFALQQNGSTLVKLHSAQVKANDKKAADARVQQWLKGHPDDRIVSHYLAEINLKGGRNKVAIEQYELMLKKHPDDILALNNLAYLLQQEKDPRALEIAERAYKLKPDTATTSDTLGWVLVEQGQTKRGLGLLRNAAAQAPQNSEIRYHLAVALAKSGDKANARKELEALLEKDQQFTHREAAQSLLKEL
jgi:putative PEP-CTERM system TPR-repeat lipoprotein